MVLVNYQWWYIILAHIDDSMPEDMVYHINKKWLTVLTIQNINKFSWAAAAHESSFILVIFNYMINDKFNSSSHFTKQWPHSSLWQIGVLANWEKVKNKIELYYIMGVTTSCDGTNKWILPQHWYICEGILICFILSASTSISHSANLLSYVPANLKM